MNIISEVCQLDEVVHLKGSLYAVNQQVAESYHKAMNNKLPSGYAWGEFGGPDDLEAMIELWLKEGQASTGDIYGRVTNFGNAKPQLLYDVIIDDCFLKKGFDQEILDWRSDLDNETDVKYDPKSTGVRTKELLTYNNIEAFIEAPYRRREAIRKYLRNDNAARDVLDIRVPTIEVLIWFIKDFFNLKDNKNIVDIYELCARFGKTIFALCCFMITGKHTLVFTAYYQSAFGSIKNELSKWKIFSDIKFVDGRIPDAQNIYNGYRKRGYKVVIICGIHKSKNWEDKYRWVRDINDSDKIIIADEVDFGVHTKSTSARVKFLQGTSYFLALSGTGADKMTIQFSTRHHRTYTMDQMLDVKDYCDNEDPDYPNKKLKELMSEIKEIQ